MGSSGRKFPGNSFLVILNLIVLIFGCQTSPYSNPTSRWEALRTAKKITCEPLPKAEQQLDYISVRKADEKGIGLISEGRDRSGTLTLSVLPLKDNVSIASDKIRSVAVSSRDTMLGSYAMKENIFGVFYSAFGGSSELQVRDLSNNVVVYKSRWHPAVPFSTLQGVRVVATKEGFFLAYKSIPSEESAEDQPVRMIFAQFLVNEQLKISSSPFDKSGANAVLVGLANSTKALLVWSEFGTGQPTRFMAAEFNQAMAKPVPVTLRISANGPIESWSMRNAGDRLLFSMIEGDSLLGEAKLRFIAMDWRPVGARVIWNLTADIGHAHVGDSYVLSQRKNPAFVVSKWLDRESTLVTYEQGAEGRMFSKAYGVFPEGTTLIDSWQAAPDSPAFALMRGQKGLVKEYLLCELSL